MMTNPTNANPEGLWLSLSDLARARGVTKGPLSRRIGRLEGQGLLTTRPGPGNTKTINLAEFDKVTGETTDAIRQANGRRAGSRDPSDPILAREQARKTAYQADLAQLELGERLGTLMPVEAVRSALSAIAEVIVREIDRLPSYAEEVASAVAKDGAGGVRAVLQRVVFDIRRTTSAEILKFAEQTAARQKTDGGQI